MLIHFLPPGSLPRDQREQIQPYLENKTWYAQICLSTFIPPPIEPRRHLISGHIERGEYKVLNIFHIPSLWNNAFGDVNIIKSFSRDGQLLMVMTTTTTMTTKTTGTKTKTTTTTTKTQKIQYFFYFVGIDTIICTIWEVT